VRIAATGAAGDALAAVFQRRSIQLAMVDAGHDQTDDGVGHRCVEVRTEAQEVGAGSEREHRRVSDTIDAASAGDSVHVERVGDDHAVEPHSAQVLGPACAERCGLRVEGVGDDVRGEDRIHRGVDGSGERHQLAFAELGHRRLDASHVVMRVGSGVAVAGEVFRRNCDATAVEPLDSRDHMSSDELGRRAERPHSDDGLRGLELMSAHGARSRSMPIPARRAPSAAYASAVRVGSSTKPKAAGDGTSLPRAASSRVTSPPSSSIAMTTSLRACRSRRHTAVS
jgi:hypothetical protein